MATPRFPRRAARAGIAAAALVSAVAAMGGGATAAPPAGEVRVSPAGPSSLPQVGQVLLADADRVLYAQQGELHAGPSGGGAAIDLGVPAQPADAATGGTLSLAGDMVRYFVPGQGYRYRDLATGRTGAAPSQWAAASPDGGVYAAVAGDGTTHGYDATAGTGATTDLGVLPGLSGPGHVHALADATGVVFYRGSTYDYVAYGDPGSAVTLQTTGPVGEDCTSLTTHALGCSDATHVYRVPLDGSAAAVTPVDIPAVKGGIAPYPVALLTDSTTGWWFAYAPPDGYTGPLPAHALFSVPESSPTATPGRTSFVVDRHQEYPPVSSASRFYVEHGSTPVDAGIYSLTSAGAAPQAFHLFGTEPLLADAEAVATGQAWFVDNSNDSTTAFPADDREALRVAAVTRSGHAVQAGRTRTVTTVYAGGTVFASGSRALYQPVAATKPSRTVSRVASSAGGGTAHAGYRLDAALPLDLSGTRALVKQQTGRHHVLLVDLVTRRTTDLTRRYDVSGPVALWGRYVAFGTPDGAIRRLDLGTGKVARVAGPTATSRDERPTDIATWGDYVAWDYYRSHDSPTYTFASYFRDARTMSERVALPAHDSVAGASADGTVLKHRDGTTGTTVRSWRSGATQALPGGSHVDGSVALYQRNYAGYAAGAVYAAPLTHAANPPRSLGNPFGATSISHTGSWHLDLPTSAVLTSCSVTLRSAGHVVRTLPCGRALMAVGEVSVGWDGRRASGKRVHPGRFTWTVSASNADGRLVASDGSHSATHGSITVRAA